MKVNGFIKKAADQEKTIKNDAPSNSFTFKEFSDIDSSIVEARVVHKKVLLYFTGNFCIYARAMESKIFTDPSIHSVLSEKFVSYAVRVDPETSSGRHHADLQSTMFHANTLPFFVILDEHGKLLRTTAYTVDIAVFMEFLE